MMKQQVIVLIENHIDGLYSKARNILLQRESYTEHDVNLKVIQLYQSFLEAALSKPYNRLYSLSSFVEDDCGLMTQQMIPFSLLTDTAKSSIKEMATEAVKLATALDVGGIDPDNNILSSEENPN